MNMKKTKKAFSLVEILLSVALFNLFVTGIVGAWLYGQESTALSGKRSQAVYLAEEGLEAVRNIRDAAFSNLADGTYGLAISGGQWVLSGTQDTTGIFTRQIVISSIDANTKNVKSTVTWNQNLQRTGSVSFDTRLTTWQAAIQLGQSGILVYGEGTVATPRFRQLSVGTLSSESSAVATQATIRHVVVKAAPNRNEMIAGIQTTAGNVYVIRWDGSTWSNEWNVAVGDGNLQRFDVSYEQNSGDALVAYTANAATNNELVYRTWNGTSWSGATTYNVLRTSGIIDAIQLEPQPSSDNIAIAWGDRNFDLSANLWNGSSWAGEPAAALETNLSKVGTSTTLTTWSFDLAFETLSGDLLVVWGVDALTDARYATRSAAGAWSTVTTNTSFLEEATDMELSSDPNSNYIAYANITDNGGDADAAIWNGSAWGPFSNFDTAVDTVAAGTSGLSVSWISSGTQDRAIVTYDDANAAGVDWLYYNKNTNAWSALQTDYAGAPAPAGVDDKLHRLRVNPLNKSELFLLVIDANSDLFAKKLSFDGTNLVWSSIEPGLVALETTMSSITGFSADLALPKQ